MTEQLVELLLRGDHAQGRQEGGDDTEAEEGPVVVPGEKRSRPVPQGGHGGVGLALVDDFMVTTVPTDTWHDQW